jgi:hypothetical protein
MTGGHPIGEAGGVGGARKVMNGSPRKETSTTWLATARRPEIVGRALRVAAVVGTILVAINYTDRLLAGTLAGVDWLKMGITYLVPYCVSTYSAVAVVREAGDCDARAIARIEEG